MRLRTLFAVCILLALAVAATAAVPPMINYQGKLLQPSGAAVPDGTYSMVFAIYDVPTGGTALWSETNPSVQVRGGLFAVLLGSMPGSPIISNLFDSQARFFGVKVGSDPEMTPRQQIASVGFAVKASSADVATTVPEGAITTDKLGSLSVTGPKIVPGAVDGSKIAPLSVTADKIVSGAVTNDQVSPAAAILTSKLDFSPMAFLDGAARVSPKITSGLFVQATVAGQRVEHDLHYGIAFTASPIVVVTPGPGSVGTDPCNVSVQQVFPDHVRILISDTTTNPYREFHWIAIGY